MNRFLKSTNSTVWTKSFMGVTTTSFRLNSIRTSSCSTAIPSNKHTNPSTISKTQVAIHGNILTNGNDYDRRLSSLPSLREYPDDDDAEIEESIHVREDAASPSHLSYVSSGPDIPISSTLHIVTPREDIPGGIWPVFRVMDENGIFRNVNSDGYKFNIDTISMEQFDKYPTKNHSNEKDSGSSNSSNSEYDLEMLKNNLIAQHPDHESIIRYSSLFTPSLKSYNDMPAKQSNNSLLRCHRIMIRLRTMDDILHNAQRQGRISFYLTCRGEEAVTIGSASALHPTDFMLTQYREQGLLMWRGFTLEQFTNQCFGNDLDLGRGRQMPIHYGSRALNFLTVSSPLGTQMPQAVGIAYKMKLDALSAKEHGNNDHEPSVAAVYFGEGASSTGDFHSACNFAATLKVPVLFFCRNNGYAISTSTREQFASDGVVCKAKGYGMAGIRVDGNDLVAVHAATKAAREYALKHMEPVLIELITYRQGHHSTSDDSTQYRSSEEVLDAENKSDPITRFSNFLIEQNCMSDSEISDIEATERKAVLDALDKAEARPEIKLQTLFQDVYHEIPQSLQKQERELREHLKKYSDKYK